jgi:hypothetical protein
LENRIMTFTTVLVVDYFMTLLSDCSTTRSYILKTK